ncbi:LOW QUALITY PROTEIN: C2 calcium-dependent domain-containing protein 4C [Dermochelys coriacea]|uniref:LOW QUALITY PROTEIN: C2 calcium-dependent domain-containing protein 4C n=1 Tax=Dermochelys coriacea TaxID=27794 RepID=UPI001CA8314D|nr:LOW QUALITY PROTEIN: C2 calcium-dependent domain-containing protein 4C [Dermochelys coriacea]
MNCGRRAGIKGSGGARAPHSQPRASRGPAASPLWLGLRISRWQPRRSSMWLLERIRGSVENGAARASDSGEKQSKGPLYSNVLTPDKIPDFFIPPKLTTVPPEAEGAEGKAKPNLGTSASEQNLSARKPQRSPRLPVKAASESKNLLKAASRHIIQIESADEWASEEDFSTNADPQAQTAMSLPYVPKAQTSYGFATLLESPHTRRKESLFHSEHGSLCQSQVSSPSSPRKGAAGGGKVNGESARLTPSDIGMSLRNPYRYFSGGESDTCSSAESSPFSSPLLSRSVSLLKIFSQDSQAKAIKLKHPVARNSSLSTDDSSADTSPSSQRRVRGAPPLAGGAPPPSLLPLDSPDRLHREHTVRLSKGGSVRLTAEYDAANARLRVRVIAAEELFDKLCDARSINCCVSLCLNPGKVQKQRSTIVKNSRSPVFNEDFFFDCLGAGSVKKMALKVKVVNKGSSLKRDTLLGERELPLTSLLPFL